MSLSGFAPLAIQDKTKAVTLTRRGINSSYGDCETPLPGARPHRGPCHSAPAACRQVSYSKNGRYLAPLGAAMPSCAVASGTAVTAAALHYETLTCGSLECAIHLRARFSIEMLPTKAIPRQTTTQRS